MTDVFNQMKDYLTKLATDITTLEVYTYTGNLTVIVKPDSGVDWSQLKNSPTSVGANGELKLVAATHVDVDFDVLNYQAADAADNLVKAHAEFVKSSHESRAAAVKLVADFFHGK